MVARIVMMCAACGSGGFSATTIINDLPEGVEGEWMSRLLFACNNCATVVAEVESFSSGKIELTTNLCS